MFDNNRLTLTEENKKQQPERQHFTMSYKISKSTPKNLDHSKTNQISQKNYSQKSGNKAERYPKIPEHHLKNVPKMMAHPLNTTYGSSPPPPPPPENGSRN